MSIRKARGLLFLPLAALFLLLVTAPVLAVGFGVTPEKLNIEVSRGGSATATLNVVNSGSDESSFKVYVEEERYKGWFVIEPEEFTLPAQGTKAVEVSVRPPVYASGEHEARICVVSLPPGEGLAIGTGIKVPTYIHISAMLSLLWIIGIVAVVAIILVIVLRRRRA